MKRCCCRTPRRTKPMTTSRAFLRSSPCSMRASKRRAQRWRWSSIMKAPGRGASNRKVRTSPISISSCASIGRCGARGFPSTLFRRLRQRSLSAGSSLRLHSLRQLKTSRKRWRKAARRSCWARARDRRRLIFKYRRISLPEFCDASSTFASDVPKAFDPAHGLRFPDKALSCGGANSWLSARTSRPSSHRKTAKRRSRDPRTSFISPVGRTKNC